MEDVDIIMIMEDLSLLIVPGHLDGTRAPTDEDLGANQGTTYTPPGTWVHSEGSYLSHMPTLRVHYLKYKIPGMYSKLENPKVFKRILGYTRNIQEISWEYPRVSKRIQDHGYTNIPVSTMNKSPKCCL